MGTRAPSDNGGCSLQTAPFCPEMIANPAACSSTRADPEARFEAEAPVPDRFDLKSQPTIASKMTAAAAIPTNARRHRCTEGGVATSIGIVPDTPASTSSSTVRAIRS